MLWAVVFISAFGVLLVGAMLSYSLYARVCGGIVNATLAAVCRMKIVRTAKLDGEWIPFGQSVNPSDVKVEVQEEDQCT